MLDDNMQLKKAELQNVRLYNIISGHKGSICHWTSTDEY